MEACEVSSFTATVTISASGCVEHGHVNITGANAEGGGLSPGLVVDGLVMVAEEVLIPFIADFPAMKKVLETEYPCGFGKMDEDEQKLLVRLAANAYLRELVVSRQYAAATESAMIRM
jgi:hypothetical protein